MIRDPFGHRWFVQTQLEADDVPVEDVPGRRFGDIGYVTLRVPDAERASRFYGALFGWTMHGGPEGFHIASITPPAGIQDRVENPETRVLLPRRRHRQPSRNGSASSAARCCRSPTTTPAATPSAATTKASASTSSAPARLLALTIELA